MPELPEVETIVRGLRPLLEGRRVEAVWWSGKPLHMRRPVDLRGLRALAVGHVIANRAESGRFPSSYCGVLFQRSQFSFIHGRSLPSVPRASQDWLDAVAIAKIVDQELHPSPVGKALFFHARRVSPGWRLTRVGALGNHIFYR